MKKHTNPFDSPIDAVIEEIGEVLSSRSASRRGSSQGDAAAMMVKFVINYRDGAVALMKVDEHALARGDHVVRIIAREQQEAGTLREGEIVSVRRL